MNKNIIKTGLLLSAALMLTLVACNRVLEEVDSVSKEKGADVEVLTLIAEPQTKATLGNEAENPTKTWEDGDMIAVWAGKTETNGSFQNCSVFSSTVSVNLYGGTYHRFNYAVYPYQYTAEGAVIPSYNAGTGALSVTLPATYDYATVGGTKNPVPMVAKNLYTDGNDLTFYTVGALVRISTSGIPSKARKLVVSFDKTVTGEFEVNDLSTLGTTNVPHIDIDSESASSTVTINVTPGTDCIDYINIPVPTGSVKVTSLSVYDESDALVMSKGSIGNELIPSWTAARAHGKKASVTCTPSIGSMIVSPGNLYTALEGKELLMANNWYEHMYVLSGADQNDDGYADDDVNKDGAAQTSEFQIPSGSGINSFETEALYSIQNRTHFNWNEMYYMFQADYSPTTNPVTWSKAIDNTLGGTVEEIIYTYDLSKDFGGKTWHVPSKDEMYSLFGRNRSGAIINGNCGLVFLKVLVTDMEANEGTTRLVEGEVKALTKLALAPIYDVQAGILFLPDNVEIPVSYFSVFSAESVLKGSLYTETQITKANLNILINSYGCAFLPALGHWTRSLTSTDDKVYPFRMNGVGKFGAYLTSTQGPHPTVVGLDAINGAYYGGMDSNSGTIDNNCVHWKNDEFDSIRLVRDAFPVAAE